MDLSEAFDTINHEFLVAKPNAYAFSKEKIRLIFSYINKVKLSGITTYDELIFDSHISNIYSKVDIKN